MILMYNDIDDKRRTLKYYMANMLNMSTCIKTIVVQKLNLRDLFYEMEITTFRHAMAFLTFVHMIRSTIGVSSFETV